MRFADRSQAGRALAARLVHLASDDVIVLGLPRGGVPVALEVARALHAPLDVFPVNKLGVPGHEEWAMGAIAKGGVMILDRGLIAELGVPSPTVEAVARRARRELARRERAYRGGRRAAAIDGPRDVRGRTALLVDDGLATGASLRAAIAAVKRLGPARVVVGVPVAAPESAAALAREVDELVTVAEPEPFVAVGRWYRDFTQVSDDDVRACLERAEAAEPARPTP